MGSLGLPKCRAALSAAIPEQMKLQLRVSFIEKVIGLPGVVWVLGIVGSARRVPIEAKLKLWITPAVCKVMRRSTILPHCPSIIKDWIRVLSREPVHPTP
jgi:hypothetical protein